MLDKVRESVDQLRQSALGTIKGILDPALVARAFGISGETVEGALAGPLTGAQTGAVMDASGMTAKPTTTGVDASGVTAKLSSQPEPWTPTRIAMLTVKIFFALVFASFAANELMFEPKSIRVLVFLLVLWLVATVDIMWILLLLAYLVRAMWVKYYNRRWEVKLSRPGDDSTEAERTAYQAELNRYKLNRKNYIPRIFAFLPLTTVEGSTRIARFLKYPFYYPKTDNEEKWINVEQYKYENDLKGSMFNWDAMLAIGKIKNDFEEFHKELTELNRRVLAPEQLTTTEGNGAVPIALEPDQKLTITNPMGQQKRTLRKSASAGIELAATAPSAPESKDVEQKP